MSRRFALALVAVVLLQFCSLYAWQRYDSNEHLQMVSASLIDINEQAVASHEKLVNSQIKSYEAYMEDITKVRFAPLANFVTYQFAAYENLMDKGSKLKCKQQAISFIDNLHDSYGTAITTDPNSFDFTVEDMEVRRKSNELLAAKARAEITTLTDEIDPALQCVMVRTITLIYLQATLIDVISMCGGKADYIDSFFPVFNADRSGYQRGDTLNARVSVGSYCSSLKPENVVLTVDGKEYPIGPDGTAKFQTTERKRGQHTLTTKVVVTNPLTGEVQAGEGSFTYRVY